MIPPVVCEDSGEIGPIYLTQVYLTQVYLTQISPRFFCAAGCSAPLN
jgi:hypothetical protein